MCIAISYGFEEGLHFMLDSVTSYSFSDFRSHIVEAKVREAPI